MHAPIRFGNVEVRPAERQLLVAGRPAALGGRAFDLLLALIEHRDRVVSKTELFDRVWPGLVVEENNLQVQISALRKLLAPQAIATIPGRGYRFTVAIDGAAVVESIADLPAPTPAAPLTNLPAVLPPLYGRDADLQALRSLIDGHRIVTVVGAGGIGKTALAQTVAHEARNSFEDGVWLVELAPVADAALVATTVAGVLRITLGAEAQIAGLVRALGTSRMLIVLDNCEHLVERVAELASAVYRDAPNARLLATSQEPLRVTQEQLYRLGTLALPDDVGIERGRKAGAIALFEARTRETDPHFALSEQNVAAVVEICRHLDGIALAIELAAARVPLLGVEGLRARLDERFRILTGGARLALRRHQTLRAALEWSYGLLTPEEQTVFRRLGVFVGSFGLDSARYVAAAARLDEWTVLDHLGALVDKSLVVAEAGEEPRYRLLETSRAFALEKLNDVSEAEVTLRRHAEAMLVVFEQSRREEYVLSMQARLDRYLPDLDNARAALDWSSGATGDVRLQVALAGAIGWIWIDAGLRSEGLRRTQSAVARVDLGTPPAVEARLLLSLTRNVYPRAGSQEIAADARAVELLRELGDRRELYVALCRQVVTLTRAGRIEDAERALREAEQLFEASWPPFMRTEYLSALCRQREEQRRFEEWRIASEEFLQLVTFLGDKRNVLRVSVFLEQAAAALGRLEESVARGREMRNHMTQDRSLRFGYEDVVLANLSMALIQLDRVDEALDVARDALPSEERAGRLFENLDTYALLAFKRGRVDDAARLVGRSVLRFATSDTRRFVVEQKLHEELMAKLRDILQPDRLGSLMKEGEALSDEEAAGLALRE